MKKILSSVAGLLVLAAIISGCARAQTGTKESDDALAAFNALVKANKPRKGYHEALKHWGLSLPYGAKFEWTKDTGANDIDFAMVIPAEPFLKAGLDVKRIPADSGYVFQAAKTESGESTPDLLLHPVDVSAKKSNSQGSEDAMRRILMQNPSMVEYHAELEQFWLPLSKSFEVRWTKKAGTTAADMTFLIPADPLFSAGLDMSLLDKSWVLKTAEDEMDMGENPNQLVQMYTLGN